MSTLSVANIKNALSDTNAIEIDSNNNVVFRADMTILGSASIGNMTISEDFTVGDLLTVNGNTVLGNAPTDTLTVSGPATFASSLGVTGNTTLGGSLSYIGTLTGGTGVINIGSGQFYKDADGNVGIGTATTNLASLTVQRTSGDASILAFATNTAGTSFFQASGDSTQNAVFRTFGTTNGGVLFGQALAGWTALYSQGAASNGLILGTLTAKPLILGTNNAERLRIDSAGNVGIGTSTPSSKLFVSTPSVSGVTTVGLAADSPSNIIIRGNKQFLFEGGYGFSGLVATCDGFGDKVAGVFFGSRSGSAAQRDDGVIAFATRPQGDNTVERLTERARISSAGNLLVGTTFDNGQKIQVAGNLSFNNGEDASVVTDTLVGLDFRPLSANSSNASRFAGVYFSDDRNNTGDAFKGSIRFHTIGAGLTETIERCRVTNAGYFKASNTGSYGNITGLVDQSVSSNHLFQSTVNGESALFVNNQTNGAGVINVVAYQQNASASGRFFAGINNGTTQFAVFNNGNVQAGAGTATTPAYSTTGDTNTGAFFPAADNYAISTGGAERARITSGGYFKASNNGIYTSQAGANTIATAHAHISQNALGIGLVVANSNATSAAQNLTYVSDLHVSNTLGYHFRATNGNFTNGTQTTIVYEILQNGNVRNLNNSYGAISDAKLKENVVDASSYLDRFMQVRFRNFNFIGSDLKQFGVIAQELEQVFPGLVDTTPDVDEEGNDLGTVTKSVKYSVLALMAGKVIQEQQEIINQQQATINDILARLQALEAK